MSYNAKVYMKQGGDELVVDTGGKITAGGTQASAIANLTITADLSGIKTETPMTAEQAAALGADLAAIATKLNAILAALEGVGILASE